MSLSLQLYRGAAALGFALASPWLERKYAGVGLKERRGIYDPSLMSQLRERGRPLWVHAVSVGEVQSAAPFLRRAKVALEKRPVILSTITPTGREMAGRLLQDVPDRVISYPWDSPVVLNRALNALRPKVYVTVETEIWPGMLWEMSRRSVPAFMVNGRFSDKTYLSMRRFRSFWRDVLSCYTGMMVRSRSDMEKLIDLGVEEEKIEITGDCKADALMERKAGLDKDEILATLGGGGPIVLAGSTHTGEDEIVMKAFRKVLNRYPDARLVIVPRHPERSRRIARSASNLGPVSLYSRIEPGWRTLVVDAIGVLFGLYSVADCAFVGGSIAPRGGQNIMEAALFGVPFCQGPHYEDFVEATDSMVKMGICTMISDEDTMATAFLRDLDGRRREKVEADCRTYFQGLESAADRSWEIVAPYLN
jgi:3-deoxy-D-manno-octulosonic-acid transferase